MVKRRPQFKRLIRLGERIAEKAEKITLPFFDGVPLYDVGLFFWRSIVDGAITTRASAIAFSFFIALFPFLIFLFTLIPYIPIENFQVELMILIKDLVPDSTYETIQGTLIDIITQPRGDLLSFGFLAALIFSTNGLASMMSAFDATVNSIYRRTWVSQRITAIWMLLVLSFLLTIAIALITGGQVLIKYLEVNLMLRGRFLLYLLTFGKWVIIVFLFFFAYSFLYFMAPAKRSKWRFISIGGTFATISSLLTFAVFAYYINNFGQYNKLYGSIGTLLIVLLLVYAVSVILLVGFELNASIYQAQTQNQNDDLL